MPAKNLKPQLRTVLYEDNHLLVIDKPAGIATMGVQSGPTLHSMAADYIGRKYNKPGKVFIGFVSRLDTVTSGVIVMARTSKAASRLTAQFATKEAGGPCKLYLAVVQGHLNKPADTLRDLVYKDDQACRMRVSDNRRSDAKQATLAYETVAETEDATMVAVRLISGRKHQIRVQFADRGHPILGDRKYGSNKIFSHGIGLHSYKLSITHPTLKNRLDFFAPPPSSWNRLGVQAAIDSLSRSLDG